MTKKVTQTESTSKPKENYTYHTWMCITMKKTPNQVFLLTLIICLIIMIILNIISQVIGLWLYSALITGFYVGHHLVDYVYDFLQKRLK